MIIPPSLQISSITSPCICHFKDKKHQAAGPPHFYVVIPVNGAIDLVLTMVTSQIESITGYYSNYPKAFASLVAVDANVLPFLNRQSLINCNQIELIAKTELAKKFDPAHGFEMKMPAVPDVLMAKIIEAVENSPIVKPVIKKLLNAR